MRSQGIGYILLFIFSLHLSFFVEASPNTASPLNITSVCPEGYQFNTAQTACEKVDEMAAAVSYAYSCPSGYTLSDTSCIKNEAHSAEVELTCGEGAGWSRSGNNCSRTLSQTASSQIVYSCPSGYARSGTRCTKSETKTAPSSLQCFSGGWTLSGANCIRTVSQAASISYTFSCPSGWTTVASSCRYVESKAATKVYYCAAGKRLFGNSCRLIKLASLRTLYSCPSGYSRSGTICRKTDTKPATASTVPASCPSGYSWSASRGKCRKQVRVIANLKPTNMSCFGGEPMGGGKRLWQCWSEVPRATQTRYSCSAGWTVSGSRCSKTLTQTASSRQAYYCPIVWSKGEPLDWRVSGSSCIYYGTSYPAPSNYTCSSGFSVSGSRCLKTHTLSATRTTNYSCPAGYIHSGTSCRKTQSKTASRIYQCATGWTLSGARCNRTLTQTASSRTVYSCPAGYGLTGSTCSKSEAKNAMAKTQYLCPTGFSYNSSLAMCRQSVVILSPIKPTGKQCSGGEPAEGGNRRWSCWEEDSARLENVYRCGEGWSVLGSQCQRTLTQVASQSTQYTCPAGWEREGQICSMTSSVDAIEITDADGQNAEPYHTVNLDAAVLNGQAGVSGGQASYQIPVDLPPGRAGIQPKVSLSYHSQSGNGVAGVGWSLNAGSAISRCGATYAQDGFTRAVTFNADTDRLCLNGQRLITSGRYGTSGAEYRTEMDSFVKVVQSGEVNGASTRFTVYRPDGSIATYGANADSRFTPGGLTTTLSWKVTQESWSSGKNTIDYEYDTSIAGEHLLSKIKYTGTENTLGERYVAFTYDARNDARISYLAGGMLQTTRRLTQVNTFETTNKPVHRYLLGYRYSLASGRSLVSGIQECGFSNTTLQCTSPTLFDWSETTHISEPQRLKIDGVTRYDDSINILGVIPHGDVNGDGTVDWPGFNTDAEQGLVNANDMVFQEFCRYNVMTASFNCVEIDINQDGKADPLRNMNGELQFDANQDGHYTSSNISLNNYGLNKVDRILSGADFNGDGFPDLLIYRHNDGQAKLALHLHTGDTLNPYLSHGETLLNYTYKRSSVDFKLYPTQTAEVIGDIDGNGLPDILVSELEQPIVGSVPGGNPKYFLLNKSRGDHLDFTTKELDINSYSGFPANYRLDYRFFSYFNDMNGDNLPDWFGWEGGELVVRMNDGTGTFHDAIELGADSTLLSRYFRLPTGNEGDVAFYRVPKFNGSLHFVDINGDGLKELLLPGERIIESCVSLVDPFKNGSVNNKESQYCGDQIYGDISSGYSAEYPTQLIDVKSHDHSIYRYDAIYFDKQTDGSYLARREASKFEGSASEIAFIDAFGDGLIDAVYTYGPDSVSTIVDKQAPHYGVDYGAYIVRNYGAGDGLTTSDYGAVDYLQFVTDGLGNTSQWRYRPLSTGEASAGQTKMYDTDHDYVGDGYIHFGSSMYVVQSFEQSNGIGGVNETEYAYKGAMYNLQGRGFTGFREVVEKDVSRNKVTLSVFKQKFPFVSLLESQTVSVNGITVAMTAQSWADNPQHTITGVYHNINTRTITNSYGLSGSSERRSAVEQTIAPSAVDEFGNISKRTQTVTDYIDGGANSYQTVVDTVFTPDTDNWFLSKFNAVMTTNTVENRDWVNDPTVNADIAQVATQTVESWDETHHKPTRIVYTASGSACSRSDVMVFNDYGLPLSSTVTGQSSACSSLSARTTSFNYTKNGSSVADDGYLPYQVTNAKGHITTTEYNMGLGVPTKVTAPNSIVTQTQYDAIGRPVQVSQTGSPIRYIRYLLAASWSHSPSHAKLLTRITSAGMPIQEEYQDSLGRPLRSATQGFDGSRYQYLDKQYDSLGHLTHESLPYFNGDTPEYTVFSGFDAFDRPATRSLPNGESGGLMSTYGYTGLTTDITVEGRTLSRTYGMQGLLYETVDAADGSNRFSYDGGGRPLIIEDANHNKIVASYNGFGHKTRLDDPNQGTTTFGYNTLGELDSQTDANGITQTFVLDTLGRITAKTFTGSQVNGNASYTWDTRKQGLLTSETQQGIDQSYTYTDNLQLATSSITVSNSHGGDGVTRTVGHQYDSFYGRPIGLTYPNGLMLEYRYNDSGYLSQTRNVASNYIYRTITDRDAAGHITGAALADELMSQVSAYNSEGTMASTQVTSSLGQLHNHYYERYDSFMNLTAERNAVTGLEKSYVYDNLNRLKQYSFSNGGFALYDNSTPFAATVDYGYDAVGNLLKKSDYSVNTAGAYEYGACNGPNRVCAITKPINNQRITFSYDSRGNLLTGDGLTMTYNALDKPLTINGRGPSNNTRTAFVYGSDNMRALQTRTVSGKTTKTHYVGKLFESDNDGSWRAYIDDIAVLSYTPDKGNKLLFTLRDRLGSATTLVDEAGNIISQRYFDPFGRTATASAAGSLGDLLDTNRHRRGFTDHEHLNEQQLIHMNGRVYDYNMGRFMSVDPFIQSPTSTQSVNPYSYIMNNPLSGTDPTGYVAEEKEFKIKVATTGSRIKRSVTATVSSNGKGGATVTFSGGNGASRSAAKNAVAGKLSGAGFKVSDIGGQKAISSSSTWNKSEASGVADKYTDVSTPGVDSAITAMNSNPNDLGQTAHVGRTQERNILESLEPGSYLRITGDAAVDAGIMMIPIPMLGAGKMGYQFYKASRVAKGLVTPEKFFGGLTHKEAEKVLMRKFGSPRGGGANNKSFFNNKTKRTYNLHQDPLHRGGKPHIDVRKRGLPTNYYKDKPFFLNGGAP